MHSRSMRFLGLGLGLLALMAGCSTFGGSGAAKESTKAAASLQETYERLGQGKLEIDRTVGWMDQLAKGTDLQTNFKAFSGSVTALKAAGDAASKQGAEMREERDEYLAKWEKEVATMTNPDVKESADQRRARVRAAYEAITAQANLVREAYVPYLADLQDIQKALTMDLSAGGVAAVTPAINKAKTEGEALGKKIDVLGIQIDTLRGKISPKG